MAPTNENAPVVGATEAEKGVEAGSRDKSTVTAADKVAKITDEQRAQIKPVLMRVLEARGERYLNDLWAIYGVHRLRDVPALLAPALLRDALFLHDVCVPPEVLAAVPRKVLPVATDAGLARARDNLPAELRALRAWVVCDRTVEFDKAGLPKSIKRPLNPRTGGSARSNKPNTWGTFDEAVEFAQRDPRAACVGVNLLGSEFVGTDFDGVLDENGDLLPVVRDLLQRLPASYLERSPSGRGLRGFYVGKKPAWMRGSRWDDAFGPGTGFECYDGSGGARYLTTTGDLFELSPGVTS